MDSMTPRIRSLVRQANKVADSGKRSAATRLYEQIIEEAPDTVEAWIGYSGVLRDQDEKESALLKALEIDPQNEMAMRELAVLNGDIPEESDAEDEEEAADEPDKSAGEEFMLVEEFLQDEVASPSEFLEEDVLNWDDADEELEWEAEDEEEHEPEVAAELLYCANHPNRETHLRCNRCGKPICTSCARRTPVGYRCPQCIREQEDIYFTARPVDYLIAVLIGLPLSLVAGFFAPRIGFFVIFLAAATGTLIGRLVLWGINRRRGRWMPQLVSALVVIGAALPYLLAFLDGVLVLNLGLLWSGVYIALASGAAYYQIR